MKQEQPKQETLEEAAKRFSKRFLNNGDNSEFEAQSALLGVMFGAKWQQQQNKNLYSEEEVLEQLNLLYSMKNSLVDTFTDKNDRITMKWFEQFKKK